MKGDRTIFALAESCPFDAYHIKQMKAAVDSLVQLNVKRFRVPAKTRTQYSALDIIRQALELLYEFSPSQRNYREAIRTIHVYSEGERETERTLRATFSLIANMVYNAYTAQRYAESLAPRILFMEGTTIDMKDVERCFKLVAVKPPSLGPPTIQKIVYLDEGYEPYALLLEGKRPSSLPETERRKHWAKLISEKLVDQPGIGLLRAGAEHLGKPQSLLGRLGYIIRHGSSGGLEDLLIERGIRLEITHHIPNINKVFTEA